MYLWIFDMMCVYLPESVSEYEYQMEVRGNHGLWSAAEEQMSDQFRPIRPIVDDQFRPIEASRRKDAVSPTLGWKFWLGFVVDSEGHLVHLFFSCAQTIMANSSVHLFAMIDLIFGPLVGLREFGTSLLCNRNCSALRSLLFNLAQDNDLQRSEEGN